MKPSREELCGAAAAAGAAWLGFAAAASILAAAVPRGILADDLLPLWARGTVLLAELTAVALVAWGAVGAWALWRRWAPRPLPAWPARILAAAGLVALLFVYAASWVSFWITGKFLDGWTVRFLAMNGSIVLAFAAEMHPALLALLPPALLALGVAAAEGLRRLARQGTCPVVRRFVGGWAAVTLVCAAGAVAGEGVRRFQTAPVRDPVTGVVGSLRSIYAERRDERAGPVFRAFLGGRDQGGYLDDVLPPGIELPLVRRPIVSMEEYLRSVDHDAFRRWNVVVVIVDSLRPDPLESWGGRRGTMPALDAAAREARVFLDTYTQATHTEAANPCPLSSHYPLRSRSVHRYPENPTYPRVLIYDVLKALGYRTALVSSQNERWGRTLNYLMTGGLDHFFHAGGREGAAFGEPQPRRGDVDDALTVGEAIRWIGERPEAPFFLYLNLHNAHAPYRTPDDFPRRFGKKPDFTISAGTFPREKVGLVKDVYADSLSYVDAQLARLVEALKGWGRWDETVFVVTSDHGEAFYEHGFAGHAGPLYEEIVRVPLVVRAPGLAPGRDGRPAELVDVPPTVFGLLGLPAHPSFQGADLLSLPEGAVRSRFVMTQTPVARQYAVVRGGHKLIFDAGAGRYLLYDLARDPGERRELSRERPEVVRDLAGRLAAWRRAQVEYYEDSARHAREYPPVLREE